VHNDKGDYHQPYIVNIQQPFLYPACRVSHPSMTFISSRE
jgi:hypothetical protein